MKTVTRGKCRGGPIPIDEQLSTFRRCKERKHRDELVRIFSDTLERRAEVVRHSRYRCFVKQISAVLE